MQIEWKLVGRGYRGQIRMGPKGVLTWHKSTVPRVDLCHARGQLSLLHTSPLACTHNSLNIWASVSTLFFSLCVAIGSIGSLSWDVISNHTTRIPCLRATEPHPGPPLQSPQYAQQHPGTACNDHTCQMNWNLGVLGFRGRFMIRIQTGVDYWLMMKNWNLNIKTFYWKQL